MAITGTTSNVEQAIHALKQRLGPRANDTQAVREHHSCGESYHTPAPPDVVCLPHNTDEVADIVKISARFRLPVVPFGAGTSLEGPPVDVGQVDNLRGGWLPPPAGLKRRHGPIDNRPQLTKLPHNSTLRIVN
jgi:hypothetical protein